MAKKKRAVRMLDRDVSWMYFNRRILQEAQRDNVPLLERFTFLGIYSNNLDEFYRVRVSSTRRNRTGDRRAPPRCANCGWSKS